MGKVVRFYEVGGPEVLRIEDETPRQPGPGEASIEVRAIGLNRAEAMFRRGAYLEQPALPSRIGYEVSGVLRAVGPDVSGFKPGDAVGTMPGFSQNQYGAYAEVALVPASALVANPEGLSFEEAASVWMQYTTAYGALVDIAHLGAGQAVVISAASSSVGLAAIQIARLVGATPIATTRTGAKRAALLEAGAAAVVATEEDDVTAAIMAASGGRGANVVFDSVGGRLVLKLADAMAQSGTLFQYGGLSGEETPFPTMASFANRLSMRSYILTEVVADPQRRERAVKFVLDGLRSGAFRPKIAKTFKLDQIVEAHRYMEGNEQIGKIVVTT